MCEWLLSGEWCDVQLLCNGHVFIAHRAVLASASTFIREALLSCPENDNTIIILPPFDLDAMSFVLYYIYHGEIMIPKYKLKMFMEIIQTMQIYVEDQYLYQIRDCVETTKRFTHLDVKMCRGSNLLKNTDTMSLNSVSISGKKYANVKRSVEIQNMLYKIHNSFGVFNSPVEELKSHYSGNVISQLKDRDKSSFLPDLFIETYTQNGNGNGLEADVLAMSNEHYRGPTSVVLMNANEIHPRAGGTLSETSENATKLTLHLSSKSKLRRFNFFNRNYSENDSNSISLEKLKDLKLHVNYFLENKMNNNEILKHLQLPIHLTPSDISHYPDKEYPLKELSFSQNDDIIETNKNSVPINLIMKQCDGNLPNDDEFKNKKFCLSEITRVTILNRVLQNPWCPRLSYYYIPYRRKYDDKINLKEGKARTIHVDSFKDKNNNISVKLSALTPNKATEKNVNSEIGEISVMSRSLRLYGRDELKCTPCNQVFTSNESYTSHMRRHSSNTRYSCEECFKTFSQLRNFKYHMSVHRGTKEFATTCPVCGKYFNDRGYLSSHMKIHRNRKEYKCSICPKSFNQRVAYNMHVRIHSGLKPHVCDECGKAFSRKMLLKQHQRTHSGERPFACPHCDKRFADRSNMTLHLRLHTGIKPFSCSLCPKSFTKKHHLKSHLNFHTGDKPYSCPKCKLAFTQSSNMRTHLKKCNAPEQLSPVSL